MPDLMAFTLSVSELLVIDIVVVLPGPLSHLFAGLHDTLHIWAPRHDRVFGL